MNRHRFHSLCPYFAMFPESFVEHWVEKLTKPGDTVLDPFCGRGTTPFQSLLMGRRAIGNDINPVAVCVTRAKTNAPAASTVRARLTRLAKEYSSIDFEVARRELPPFFRVAYAPETLRQVLFLRSRLNWMSSDTDCMLAALVLGALHGESAKSPSYFSNQMPRTISTKPDYSVRFWHDRGLRAPRREVFEMLRKSIDFRYSSERPRDRARVFQGDMRELPKRLAESSSPIRCVITSPPYLGVTRFEEDQWLRLWFLGNPPRPTYGLVSRDDRHEGRDGYWGLIGDMWRVLGVVCDDRCDVVVRIGGKGLDPKQLVDGVVGTAAISGRRVRLAHRKVSTIRGRQTDSFRPGSTGCRREVDCHLVLS